MKNFILFTVCALIPFILMSQEQKEIAAGMGLEKFKKLGLLQRGNQNAFTAADTSNLQLGKPLQTAIITLDKLKQYKAGQPAEGLISDIDEFVYPVINSKNQKLAGTITLAKTNDRWAATRIGGEYQLLQDSAAKYITGETQLYKLVKILAFHVSFLSYFDSGNIMFIPLQEDRSREIFPGRALKAQIVLEKYLQAANNYNGLPM